MSGIYIVLWRDRHSDTTAHPFHSREKAIEWARQKGKEFDRFGEYEETPVKGWEFYCTYSCEGDGLWVVEAKFEDEVPR